MDECTRTGQRDEADEAGTANQNLERVPGDG